MKKVEKNSFVVELKKDYLDIAEYQAIQQVALEAFMNENEGRVDGFRFNYLALEEVFFQALGSVCIQDFDDDKNRKIFESGMYWELLSIIQNANEAYTSSFRIADKMCSLENIIDFNLKDFINKIPDQKSMTKLVNKLPKEWQKAATQYDSIMGVDKNEFDKKDASGEFKELEKK